MNKSTSALLLVLLVPVIASAEDVSVEQAVDIAQKNNPSLYNVQKERERMDEEVREYWGNVYPSVNLTGSYSHYLDKQSPDYLYGEDLYNNYYTMTLGLTQTLWAGGKVSTGIEMAKLYSENAKQQVRSTSIELAKNVRTMCYDIILDSATAIIEGENLRITQQHLSEIQAKYAQGLSSDLEVIRQKVEVSNALPAVTKAQNQLETDLLALKKVLAMDPEKQLSLTTAEDPGAQEMDIDKLYKQATEARPELIMQRLQYKLQDENIQLAKSEYYPTFSAFANRDYNAQTNNLTASGPAQSTWDLVAGVKMQISIFAGGASASRVRQAHIGKDEAIKTLEDTERGIRIDVKHAWLDLNESRERLAAQEGGVDQARKALASTETRFKSGLSSQLELNDASLALNQAQLARVQALRDVYASLADLKWACGQ
jgi:outer membrane protein TolC